MIHIRNRTYVFYMIDDTLYCATLNGVPPKLPLERFGPIYSGEIRGFSAIEDATSTLSCLIQKIDNSFIMATSYDGGLSWELSE